MIALTGWGQEEDRKRSKEAGFDYHIVKPVDHVELMRLLGSLYGNTESEVADASTPGRPEEKTVR
jgi:CheY-like chemotaxis protein